MKSFFTQHGASEALAQILEALAQSCAQISDEILVTSTGKAGTQNSFGEEQAKLIAQYKGMKNVEGVELPQTLIG